MLWFNIRVGFYSSSFCTPIHRLPRETMKLGAGLLTDMKKDEIIIIIIIHKNNDNNYNNNNIIIWKQD